MSVSTQKRASVASIAYNAASAASKVVSTSSGSKLVSANSTGINLNIDA